MPSLRPDSSVMSSTPVEFEVPVLDSTEPQVVLEAGDPLTVNSVVSMCVPAMDTSDPLEEFKCELVLEISEPVVNASTSAETVEPSPDVTLNETIAGPITVPGKTLNLLSSEILLRWNLRRVFLDLGTAEQCIKFAEERRLIPTMRMCSRHRCPMRYGPALGQFGVFRCHKRNCRGSGAISRAAGTWFENLHLPIHLVFQLMYMFSQGWSYDSVQNETSDRARDSVISTKTINTWYTNCRDVIVANESKQSESYENKIGGPNRVVQIHYSQFGKRKCKGGKVFEGHLVLGMLEDGSDDLRLEVCQDNQHTAEVLVPLIKKHVEGGSIIHTDFSTAYDSLSQNGYTHNKVYYGDQSNRIVAQDGTISQRIETHLLSLKTDYKRDQLRGDFADWLVEKTWRRKNRIYHRDPFEELLIAVQNVYGIKCQDYKFRGNKFLCPDAHLCHICCHVLNRLWLFRCVCLKRSLEYPVLFSEKGTLNLQRNDLEIHTVCSENECEHYKSRNINSKFYDFYYYDDHSTNEKEDEQNKYVELYEDREFDDFFVPNYNQQFNVETKSVTPINIDYNDAYNDNDRISNYNQITDDNNDVSNDNQRYDEFINHDDVEESKNTTEEVVNNDDDFTKTDDNNEQIEIIHKKKKRKSLKLKKRFELIVLSVKEQKAELEGNRKSKKYIQAEFKCSNCALGFLFKDTYQAHMMRHEESNGEHRCGICTLRFANPAVLRSHKGLHSERYRCLKCDLMLKKRGRKKHALDCFGLEVDAAACHLCGRVFQETSGLQQHIKRFHRPTTAERRYACNVCGERCSDQAAVRTHMIKHIQRKFTCDHCTATFSSPYTLSQHLKTHAAVQHSAARCSVCGALHSGTKSLRAHMRNVHLRDREAKPPPRPSRRGPRPAVSRLAMCHLCGATFKGNSKLNRHLREVCEKNRLEEELSSYYAQDIGV